jgi:hypothetical protein
VTAAVVVAADVHQAVEWKRRRDTFAARAMHVITDAEHLRGRTELVVLTGKPLPQALWEAIQVVAGTGGTVLWEDPL